MSDDDKQRQQWLAYFDTQLSQGVCPHSGMPIVKCQGVDLCDCFDVPTVEPTHRCDECEASLIGERVVSEQHYEWCSLYPANVQ